MRVQPSAMWFATFVVSGFLIGQPVAAVQGAPEWALVPSTRIGAVDGPAALTDVTGLIVDTQGNAYVLSSIDGSIKVFSANGTLVRTLGRRGSGPGEFQAPARMGFVSDKLWVDDADLDRITLFDPLTGRYVHTLQQPPIPNARLGGFTVLGMLSDSVFVGAFAMSSNAVPNEQRPILYVHPNTGSRTLATITGEHIVMALRHPRRASNGFFTTQPFNDSPIPLFSRQAGQVVIVSRKADESSFNLRWLDSTSGQTVRELNFPVRPVLVPADVRDSVSSYLVERAMRSRGAGVTSRGDAEARVKSSLFMPRHYPPVSVAFVDSVGRIWIARELTNGRLRLWQVIDSAGRIVGQARLPKQITLLDASESSVWGSLTDELGVPFIQRYEIRQ